jgi:hypothetical protein
MRTLNYINAGLYLVNAILWALVASSPVMAIVSVVVAIGAAVAAAKYDAY